MDFDNWSHRRYNPLTQTWVLCSPHRAKRPWQGQVEKVIEQIPPQHDAKCFLCPRNARINGTRNPDYQSTYTFPNDFPAVQASLPDAPDAHQTPGLQSDVESALFKAESTRGECHVICFHPRHDLTMAEMKVEDIVPVIDAWTAIYRKFLETPYIDYCQIFENKGETMGCSNPHPHGQVWGTEQVPEEPRKEIIGLLAYRDEMAKKGRKEANLLLDCVNSELQKKVRIVCENDSFVCIVPWWAVWPFETMILPKTRLRHLLEFSDNQKFDLADILRRTTCRYDNLFECPFPYSMGLHQAPFISDRNAEEVEVFQFHIHFYPPLLRSATVKKFLVGFEMLGTAQRDLTSEQAADKLRQLPETHYRNRHY